MSDPNNTTSDWCQNFLEEKSGHVTRSLTSYVLVLVTLILITVVTLINNAIVFLALTVGRGKPSSYTLSLTFTLSLVVADLMLAGLVMPIAAYNIVSESWELGPMACRVFMSADIMLCSASILNLVGLALDRYLAVCWPLLHRRMRTRLAVGLCVVFWVLSALLSFPLVMTDLQSRGVEKDPGGRCLLQIFEQGRVCAIPQSPVYQIISISLSFFLPLFFILGFHAKVYAVAHAHAQRPKIRKLSRVFSLGGGKSHLGQYKKADSYVDSDNSCGTYCEDNNCGSSNFSDATSNARASGCCQNGKLRNKGSVGEVATCAISNSSEAASLAFSNEEEALSSPECTSTLVLSSPDDQRSAPDARPSDPDHVIQSPEDWQEMQLVLQPRSLPALQRHAGSPHNNSSSGRIWEPQKGTADCCDVDDSSSSAAPPRLLDARGRQWEQIKATKMTRFADDPNRKSVSSTKSNERKQKDRKRGSVDRTTKTVLCLVLCFVVCWLPLFITLLVDCLNSYQVPSSVIITFTWLGYVNSGLNPILYYRFNAGIRYAIRCFLCLKTSPAEN